MRMIKFQYGSTTRRALEIGPDERMNGCLSCFQVEKDGQRVVGIRSFKIHKMINITTIDRKPFDVLLHEAGYGNGKY